MDCTLLKISDLAWRTPDTYGLITVSRLVIVKTH